MFGDRANKKARSFHARSWHVFLFLVESWQRGEGRELNFVIAGKILFLRQKINSKIKCVFLSLSISIKFA